MHFQRFPIRELGLDMTLASVEGESARRGPEQRKNPFTVNNCSFQRRSAPGLPFVDGRSQSQIQDIAFTHQPAVQLHFIPGAESLQGLQQSLVERAGVFVFQEGDETRLPGP